MPVKKLSVPATPTVSKGPVVIPGIIPGKTSSLVYDVIIVGGGPAGSNAAMVLSRAHRSVLLMDAGEQRNLASHGMHNYLTRDGILPPDFLKTVREEWGKYPGTVLNRKATNACKLDGSGYFRITDDSGEIHTSRKLLLATGVTDNIPDVPGMKELWGCAVHHCPYCDGWECTGRAIGLYSQKLNGFGMALALQPYSKDVTLYTDGARYLSARQKDELQQHGICVVTGKISCLKHADGKLEAVVLQSGNELACQSLFTNHGYKTNNDLFLQLGGRCTSKGSAVVNRHQMCNIPGVFIAGDAALDAHFVIVAAAQGARAGIAIHDALLKEDNAAALAVNKTAEEKKLQPA